MVSVTIRDVPERTRDELAARAARAGQPLQEYLRAQLMAMAEKPSADDLWNRVRHRVLATGSLLPTAEIIEARGRDRT